MREGRVLEVLKGRHLRKEDPLMLCTVSGVASTKPALIRYFDQKIPQISIITTKSFQVSPNSGNREPVICETTKGNFGNSVGLRNPGMEQALDQLRTLRKEWNFRSLLNVSLSANSIEDFIVLVQAFSEVADMLELNFSCPHASAGYGASIGCSEEIASRYVREIKKATKQSNVPLFVKLTPNVEDIGSIAKAVVTAGADGLVAINTVGPLVHEDPVSHTPILQNKLGGKGGCSGRWIHDQALSCVKAIRLAVGPAIPLIGMGGVSSGFEAAAMVLSGADAVGIGSAFGTVNQKNWKPFLQAILAESEVALGTETSFQGASSESFLIAERQMAYEKHTVTKLTYYGKDTLILTLDGKMGCKAGEFAFLWLPGIGEKPFSVAHNDPLTFIVKKRGPFTEGLWKLTVGSDLYIRGIYGAPLENEITKRALLLAGGTGVAVLPSLAEQLKRQGTEMTILVGTSESVTTKALLEEKLEKYGTFTCVADDGKPGRILDMLSRVSLESGDACYLVGPEIFMAIAAKKLISKGILEKDLYLSMERMTLCGIGMCGECVCGDRLTCQWGSFMRYDYLKEHAPSMVGL